MITKAVILCVGLDIDFLPLSKCTSKEMLPILNRPIIDYYVQDLKNNGITDIIIICDKNKRDIQNYYIRNLEVEIELDDSCEDKRLEELQHISDGINISFMYVQDKDNALLKAKNFVGNDTFVLIQPAEIFWGESFVKQLLEVYEENESCVIPLRQIDISDSDKYVVADIEECESGLKVTNMVCNPQIDDCPSDMAIIKGGIFTHDIFDYWGDKKLSSSDEFDLIECYYGFIKNDKLYGCIMLGEKINVVSSMGVIKGNIIATLSDNRYREEMLQFLKDIVDE